VETSAEPHGFRRRSRHRHRAPVVDRFTTAADVEGLDAIDASPLLDIKPYMSGFAPRAPLREPRWAKELMADYWGEGRRATR
jgi:tRNA (Thr-GGU) A37 N-methylase